MKRRDEVASEERAAAGEIARALLVVRGTVQGVGFRPYVHGLARRLALAGRVKNQSGEVSIEIEGPGRSVQAFVDELGRRKVLLNFGNVEFMSSAALGKLITLHRKLQAVQGKLVLCNIAKSIMEIFEITKLNKMFTITPDQHAGLQAF